MSTTPIRCAVAGVGRMGRHHARVYAQMPEVEFVGAMDQDAVRRGSIVKEWGGEAFGSVDALIDAGIDAVTIATPTTTHRALAEKFLEAGVHCLIEKPLAPDSEDAAAITAAAERANRVLQVGHVVRYDPVMRAVQAIDGVRPRFIEMIRVSPMTFRSIDVGVVLDMMIHDLDLLMMLVGTEPEEVHANAISVLGEAEDMCNARLVFPADCDGIQTVANVTASRLAFKTERKLRIISEDIYISADFGDRSGKIVRKSANQRSLDDVRSQLQDGEDLSNVDYLSLVNIDSLKIEDEEPLRLQAEAFLHAIQHNEVPDVDAEAGAAAVRTAERIVEAARMAGARMV